MGLSNDEMGTLGRDLVSNGATAKLFLGLGRDYMADGDMRSAAVAYRNALTAISAMQPSDISRMMEDRAHQGLQSALMWLIAERILQ